MATKNGIESRETAKGVKRYRGVLHTAAAGMQRGPWGTYAEAKSWRTKAQAEVAAGVRRAEIPITLREAWEAFYASAQAGTATAAGGRPFKPSTLRGYERGWKRVDPELGAHRISEIRRVDLQALIDRWAAEGVKPATIRNTLDPLRTIFRRAIVRDLITVNPTIGLEVPKVDNARERFASREEAAALIAALPPGERAIWATALYGGLRRGELRALRWTDVDLQASLINVRRSWDDEEGEQTPKTKAAVRRIHIVPLLADYLRDHQQSTGRGGSDLVFGRTDADPFVPTTVRNRALAAWKKAELAPIGLHECRHTFASLMIAAGCNAKALSVVMGHASITITFDRYGKLMPGGEAEVGRLLATYLTP